MFHQKGAGDLPGQTALSDVLPSQTALTLERVSVHVFTSLPAQVAPDGNAPFEASRF